MIDMVVPRRDLRDTLIRIIDLLRRPAAAEILKLKDASARKARRASDVVEAEAEGHPS